VNDALRTVYGDYVDIPLRQLIYNHPRLSAPELLTKFRSDPCSNETNFFRHGDITDAMADEFVNREEEPTITQIGFSGAEVMTLAMTSLRGQHWAGRLFGNDHYPNFRLRGFTVSQQVLDSALGPFSLNQYDEHNIHEHTSM